MSEALRVVLAATFLVAFFGKVRHPGGTREMLEGFSVPPRASAAAGLLLVAAEATTAIAVLIDAWAQAGATAAAALLVLFTAVVGRALASGAAPVCACFGQARAAPVSRRTIGRNGALIGLALVCATNDPGHLPLPGALGAPLAAAAIYVLATRRQAKQLVRLVGRAPDGGDTFVLLADPDCGPCAALVPHAGRWPTELLRQRRAVLVSPRAWPSTGDLTLAIDPDQRIRHLVDAPYRPSAVLVGPDGRLSSPVVSGAEEVELLARGTEARDVTTVRRRSFGVVFEVAVDDRTVLAEVEEQLPRPTEPSEDVPIGRWTLLTRAQATAARTTVVVDHIPTSTFAGPADATEAVAAAIRLAVAEHAPNHSFVHAGCVAWRGRAIVVPGRSFSGKTSLVAAFLRAGAAYLSDEYAVLDREGRIWPYDKPLSIRRPGETRQEDVAPERFGARYSGPALRLGAVVRLPYDADAASPRMEPRSAGNGAMDLLDNCVGVRRDPARTMQVLRKAVQGADVLHGVRGEADAAAALVLAELDRRWTT